MQMQYKNVYVAYVSMGANPACTEESRLLWRLSEGTFGKAEPKGRTSGCATVKAFNEAENYNGPYPPRRRRARRGGYAGCDHHRVHAQALAVGFAVLQPSLRSKASSAHLKQLVKKIGQDKAMEMLKGAPL